MNVYIKFIKTLNIPSDVKYVAFDVDRYIFGYTEKPVEKDYDIGWYCENMGCVRQIRNNTDKPITVPYNITVDWCESLIALDSIQ